MTSDCGKHAGGFCPRWGSALHACMGAFIQLLKFALWADLSLTCTGGRRALELGVSGAQLLGLALELPFNSYQLQNMNICP